MPNYTYIFLPFKFKPRQTAFVFCVAQKSDVVYRAFILTVAAEVLLLLVVASLTVACVI